MSKFIKLSSFTEEQVYGAMVWFKSSYDQGYSKVNLSWYLEKAYNQKIKSGLKIDIKTGTVSDKIEWLEKFSNPRDWEGLSPEDKDPLYYLAHNVKCEAIRLYNTVKYSL